MSQWSDFLLQQAQESVDNGFFVAVVEDVVVEIAGADAAKLLQGQITADVGQLNVGDFTLSALCTNKGRVISSFQILRTEHSFLCRLPADNAEQFIATLKKYGVFYKVEISKREDLGIVVVFDAETPPSTPDGLRLEHNPRLIEYWLDKTQWQASWIGLTASGNPAPNKEWQLAKISMGWPDIHEHTSEQFLPHALSLDLAEAISFTKGCYTGQEIVARTHYRGKSKKRLARLQLETTSVSPGTEFSGAEGRNLGTILNAVDSTPGCSEALVSVVDMQESGEVTIADKNINYKILDLPWRNE